MARFQSVKDQREIAAAGQLLPVYITSFEVENFRCFRGRQTLSLKGPDGLPAKWTIILGDNNSGKTSLLESIASTFPITNGSRELDEESKEPKGPIRLSTFASDQSVWHQQNKTRDHQFRFRCELHVGERVKKAHTNGSLTVEQQEVETFDAFFEEKKEWLNSRHTYRSIAFGGGPEKRVTLQEVDLGRSHPGSKKKGTYVSLLAAYGAMRIGKSTETASLSADRFGDNVASLFSPTAPLRNPEDWLLQVDYASRLGKQARPERRGHRLTLVKDALLKFLPEVKDIKIVQPAMGGLPSIQFETRFGDHQFSTLSFGYQTVLRWIVDLASRMMDHYPFSDDFLMQPAVVLVDEIDLHLHPRWQRQIMATLSEAFPNVQFIATSHSPLIVQAVPDANTAVLKTDNSGVTILNERQSVEGWRLDQILTSDLFGLRSARPPQTEELMERRRAILIKEKLTSGDRRELKKIEGALGPLPAGNSAEEIKALDIIRRAATRLNSKTSD